MHVRRDLKRAELANRSSKSQPTFSVFEPIVLEGLIQMTPRYKRFPCAVVEQAQIRWLSNNNLEHIFHTGDSGYPLTNCLLTPFPNPQTTAQDHFNTPHGRARSVVECTIWHLKFMLEMPQ